MTVIFLWRTVWEPFLEDSTSHRFMHPVEWRGRLPRYEALRQEQACLAANLPRLAQRHSFPRYLWPPLCAPQSAALSGMLFVLALRRLAPHARCPGLPGRQNGASLLGPRPCVLPLAHALGPKRHTRKCNSLKAILRQRGEFYETILDTIDSTASLSFHSDRLRVLE